MLTKRISLKRFVLIWSGILLFCQSGSALDRVTIGENGTLTWQGSGSSLVESITPQYRSLLNLNELLVGNAPGNLIEFDSVEFPGSIHPLRIQDGENVANTALPRGGGVTSPNVFAFGGFSSGFIDAFDLQLILEELITDDEGGESKAFERKNFNSLGVLTIIDLGGIFGVNRIRFYPRNTVVPSPSTPFQNDYLRAFELFTNDGSLTDGGNTIWEPLLVNTENDNPVVDVAMDPPRQVKAIRLRSTTTVNYEIDEFEVYGIGFLSTAQYLSPIYDAGQPAIWSVLRWQEEIISDPVFSNLQIRTRTGTDINPFVFTRLLHGQRNPAELPSSVLDPDQELELEEYKSLPLDDDLGRTWNAGPVRDDLINWSPFSTPLPASAANDENGALITSPGPRRYFQFRVFFNGSNLDSGRILKGLSFDLLTPPLADAIIGEIFPRDVPVSQSTSFTYALRTVAESANLRGFDTVRISTLSQVESIDAIELRDADGQVVVECTFTEVDNACEENGFQIVSVSPSGFSIRMPLITEDDVVVVLRFKTGVLTYSTNFTASVQLSTDEGAQQAIVAGNATSLDQDDDADLSGTTVLSSSALDKTQLLDRVTISPNPFTPNGDGINDAMSLVYNLLSLSIARPVEIKVYDLSGRLLRVIHDGPEANGQYTDKTWDGRNDQGKMVPPGLYLLRLAVNGDAKNEEQSRVVGVAY
jgi:hypothetical protein